MLTLVIGGSACGKSEYAESLLDSAKGEKIYIATMPPLDKECEARIEKHRRARFGRGFKTEERYLGLAELKLPRCGAILLECMSNLVANEFFDKNGAGNCTVDAIMDAVEMLCRHAEHVVIVSNELFSDGVLYDTQTLNYLDILGEVNFRIANIANRVVEVVYTIPIIHKGDGKQK